MSDYANDKGLELWQRIERLDAENKPFLEQLEAIENFFHQTDGFDNMKRLAEQCGLKLSDIRDSLRSTITRLSIPAALISVYPEYGEALEKVTQAMRLINHAVELIESAEDNFNIRMADKEYKR